jgi:hypothetical protein
MTKKTLVKVSKTPKNIDDQSLPPSRVSKMHFVNFKRALKNRAFMRISTKLS